MNQYDYYLKWIEYTKKVKENQIAIMVITMVEGYNCSL